MGMASPRGVQRDPPIILLGLVMEPEASCIWETQKHQSQQIPFIPLEQVKGLRREAWLLSCTLPVLVFSWPLSERLLRDWGGISRW